MMPMEGRAPSVSDRTDPSCSRRVPRQNKLVIVAVPQRYSRCVGDKSVEFRLGLSIAERAAACRAPIIRCRGGRPLRNRLPDYSSTLRRLFFPGTSVLHTRVRYALFVPWIYQTLYEEASPGRVAESLQRAEVRLAGRLKPANSWGVIGGLNFRARPASRHRSAIGPHSAHGGFFESWMDGYLRVRTCMRFCNRSTEEPWTMMVRRFTARNFRFQPCHHGRPIWLALIQCLLICCRVKLSSCIGSSSTFVRRVRPGT
ncbi:hypothetical protein ACVJGD_008129 [Bradyrhizobium sp. USDA 10063]